MNNIFLSSTSASSYELPIVSKLKGTRKVVVPAYAINFPIKFNDDFEEGNFMKACKDHISAGVFVVSDKDEGKRLNKELEKKEELNLDANNKARSQYEREVDKTINGALEDAGVEGSVKVNVKKAER